MLLVVPGDDCDALYLLLVIFHESSMIFKGRDILPAVEPGSINQRIDLRRNLAKVVSLHFAGAMILNTLPEIMSVLIMRNLLQSKPDAAAVSCALASVPPSIPQRSVAWQSGAAPRAIGGERGADASSSILKRARSTSCLVKASSFQKE